MYLGVNDRIRDFAARHLGIAASSSPELVPVLLHKMESYLEEGLPGAADVVAAALDSAGEASQRFIDLNTRLLQDEHATGPMLLSTMHRLRELGALSQERVWGAMAGLVERSRPVRMDVDLHFDRAKFEASQWIGMPSEYLVPESEEMDWLRKKLGIPYADGIAQGMTPTRITREGKRWLAERISRQHVGGKQLNQLIKSSKQQQTSFVQTCFRAFRR